MKLSLRQELLARLEALQARIAEDHRMCNSDNLRDSTVSIVVSELLDILEKALAAELERTQ